MRKELFVETDEACKAFFGRFMGMPVPNHLSHMELTDKRTGKTLRFAFLVGEPGEGFDNAVKLFLKQYKDNEQMNPYDALDILMTSEEKEGEEIGISVMTFEEFSKAWEKEGGTKAGTKMMGHFNDSLMNFLMGEAGCEDCDDKDCIVKEDCKESKSFKIKIDD